MRRLIEQCAAAFTSPGCSPIATIEIGLRPKPIGDNPAHATQRPKGFVLDPISNGAIGRIGALIKHQRQNLTLGLWHLEELFGIFDFSRNGFFNHDVQARLERGTGQGHMAKMGRGDNHRRADATSNERLATVKHLHRWIRRPTPSPSFDHIGNRCQHHLRVVLQPFAMGAAHITNPNHADSNAHQDTPKFLIKS